MAAKNYGTIAIVPKGEWNSDIQYKVGNVLSYSGSSYIVHTLPPIGTLPTNTDYYQLCAQGEGTATDDSAGVVKPDNITTEVDEFGTISVKKATTESLGIVRPDGSTISMNEIGVISAKKATTSSLGIVKGGDGVNIDSDDGSLSVDTGFEQAVELANIIADEAFAIVLGKISKSIATTMNLDENAFLKAMISNQYENITTKASSVALVYALKQSLDTTNSNLALKANASDLSSKANLSTANNFLANNIFYKNNGIYADAHTASAILLKVNYVADNSARAQIGFENGGYNAGILWLDTDGRLKFTDNNGVNHTIAWV